MESGLAAGIIFPLKTRKDYSAGPFRRFWRLGLDLVYPQHCLSCGAWVGRSNAGHICGECASKVQLIGPEQCRRCGMPLGPYTAVRKECIHCRGAVLRFKAVSAPCRYEGVVRELIHAFKYRKATFLAAAFGEMMIRDLAGADMVKEASAVVPVPLHRRKWAARGYNQAELLAERIVRHYGLPLLVGNLTRVRYTPSQTRLSRAQREENLRGAFAVRRPEDLKGRKILLCDDVMTTGATGSECARVLLAAGAKAVYVSVAAR